jgi:hypothetical protein
VLRADVIDLPDEGDVLCISRSAANSFVVLTSRGCVYRLSVSEEHEGRYMPRVLLETPAVAQRCVGFGVGSSDVFWSGSGSGVTKWELSRYSVELSYGVGSELLCMKVGVLPYREAVGDHAAGAVGSAAVMQPLRQVEMVVTGHADGVLRAADAADGRALWKGV